MLLITRRRMLAAGGTLAAGLDPRKPRARGTARSGRGHETLTDPPVPAPDITFVTPDGGEHHLTDFAAMAWWSISGRRGVSRVSRRCPRSPRCRRRWRPTTSRCCRCRPTAAARGRWRHSIRSMRSPGCRCCWIPKAPAARAWHVRGIPTSLVIDKLGRERARLEGSADWSTPAAAAIVRKLVAG